MLKRKTWNALIACVLLSLFFQAAPPSDAADSRRSEKDAREFLLAEDFFDSFYGVDALELIDFAKAQNSLELPFQTNPDANRACLDLPFVVDCSEFTDFELTIDVDEPSAVGYPTLYFHSGNGWYGMTGQTTRRPNGRLSFLFSASNAREEGEPAGFAAVDSVRFAFWRGRAVDAKATFRAFKTLRNSFATIDGYESADSAFIGTTSELFSKCGLTCERLEASRATPETLKKYKGVLLAIGGKIPEETIDALCRYVDDGGFLIACYNVPEKIREKLGVKTEGFVNCRRENIEIRGMETTRETIESAKATGFVLPEFVSQNSWNYFVVKADEEFVAPRVSPITGDKKAHVFSTWQKTDGTSTGAPAIILSGSGMYVSHILQNEGGEDKRKLLTSIGLSVAPELARVVVHQDWISAFSVGVEPDADAVKARARILGELKKVLRAKNVSLADVADALDASRTAPPARDLLKLDADVLAAKARLVEKFVSSQPSRPNEARFWWEHSGCGIWRGDWDRTMKELSEAGFNGVIPNMLWGGAAYYDSKVLPIDPIVQKYGDQIAQAVAAGKKYGVEVHAWMVCFNASNSSEEFLKQMSEEGRLQSDEDGVERKWLCPTDPRNRALQLAALEEVAFNYDVDGVHFDYIRFPDGETCFCDGCRERFAKAYEERTGRVLDGNWIERVKKDDAVRKVWREWRCDQITALVRETSDALRAKRPEIQISAAVFPGYPGTKDSIGQDWGLWIEKGWLDFVCPMDYTSDPSGFKSMVERQIPYAKGKCPIYPGIGMTATGISMSPEEVVLQAKIARDAGADGFTIFNLSESTATAALPAFKSGTTSGKTTRAKKPREPR